jgi:N-acetylglucosamine kinase-like BadF-type ATPase
MNRNITFGNNLRYFREKEGLTQKQLAENIGYTEKSVSKWETESGFPSFEILLKLSDFLNVSLDDLVFEKNIPNYFLGIDGGGTKTVFKLTDENGAVINTICLGSANPNDIGMDNTIKLLREGITEASRGIPFNKITLFAGISGGGLTGFNAKILSRFFAEFGFFAFGNGSDVENLITLAENEKCVLIIMGTGFIAYALNGKKRKRIAGWGQFFDEGGSGYTLGRDAITASLCDSDGSGEKTVLSSLIKSAIGETAEEHLARFYEGGKRYIASFSELVFKAYEMGDKVAENILNKNAEFVANVIDTALKDFSDENTPILFSGGIIEKENILFPLIEKHLTSKNCHLLRMKEEQVDGALRRARLIFEEKLGKNLK